LIFSYVILSVNIQSVSAQDDSEVGWAVIMEMLEYPEGWSDIPTEHADSEKWNDTLHALGWDSDHIRILHEEITFGGIVDEFEWLEENADENDAVVFFVFAHGTWMRNVIGDGIDIGAAWEDISSRKKLMAFSTCHAGEFVTGISGDDSQVRIGSVQHDELAWAGIPEENLPIIGDVFNHFFTSALLNETADTNEDGDISVEEAFDLASPNTQEYIQDTVFPAFPDYAEICNNSAPQPVILDMYGGDLSLAWNEIESAFANPYPIILASIMFATLVIILGYRHRRERRG
jgi:hypothetical protein